MCKQTKKKKNNKQTKKQRAFNFAEAGRKQCFKMDKFPSETFCLVSKNLLSCFPSDLYHRFISQGGWGGWGGTDGWREGWGKGRDYERQRGLGNEYGNQLCLMCGRQFRQCCQVVEIKVFVMGHPFSGSGHHFGSLFSFPEYENLPLGRPQCQFLWLSTPRDSELLKC